MLFSLHLTQTMSCWMANKQQRFIIVAHPIDGHVRTVMNPIQRRQERRGLREVPGQGGPIEHVPIVLDTTDTMRCRHNLPEVLPCFKRFRVRDTSGIPASPFQTPEDSGTPPAQRGRGCLTGCWCCQPINMFTFLDQMQLTISLWDGKKQQYPLHLQQPVSKLWSCRWHRARGNFSELERKTGIVHLCVEITAVTWASGSVVTCFITSLMANSFSVGSPASDKGAS